MKLIKQNKPKEKIMIKKLRSNITQCRMIQVENILKGRTQNESKCI